MDTQKVDEIKERYNQVDEFGRPVYPYEELLTILKSYEDYHPEAIMAVIQVISERGRYDNAFEELAIENGENKLENITEWLLNKSLHAELDNKKSVYTQDDFKLEQKKYIGFITFFIVVWSIYISILSFLIDDFIPIFLLVFSFGIAFLFGIKMLFKKWAIYFDARKSMYDNLPSLNALISDLDDKSSKKAELQEIKEYQSMSFSNFLWEYVVFLHKQIAYSFLLLFVALLFLMIRSCILGG